MLSAARHALSAPLDRSLARTVVRMTLSRADEGAGFVPPEASGAPLSRLRCVVGGHEFGVHCSQGNIHLRCVHCGARTRGWDIGAPRFTLVPAVPRPAPAKITALQILPRNRSLVLSETASLARRGESRASA